MTPPPAMTTCSGPSVIAETGPSTSSVTACEQSGRWGPYRQASPSPARHRPGARSARQERCLSIPSQTGREVMKRFGFAAGLVLAVVAVLGLAGPASAQVPVPFQGRLVGVDIGTPQVPPLVSVQVKATGDA